MKCVTSDSGGVALARIGICDIDVDGSQRGYGMRTQVLKVAKITRTSHPELKFVHRVEQLRSFKVNRSAEREKEDRRVGSKTHIKISCLFCWILILHIL